MADGPALIYNDFAGAVPATYKFAPGLDARLSSVSAMFDGSGASGDFLACLSVYSQDNKLIGRFFPGSAVPAGDAAEVTFAPFLGSQAAAATGGAITYAYTRSLAADITSGVTKVFNLDATGGNFITNDPANFSIASDGSNDGLAAANAGTYLVTVSARVVDKPGFRVANPETFGVHVDFSGSMWTNTNPQWFGFDASGTTNSGGPGHIWTPTIQNVFVVGPGNPLVMTVDQATGQTLSGDVNVLALYLSDSTAGV